jgi:hypothetical protein
MRLEHPNIFSALGMLGNRALLDLRKARRNQRIFYVRESPRRTIPSAKSLRFAFRWRRHSDDVEAGVDVDHFAGG